MNPGSSQQLAPLCAPTREPPAVRRGGTVATVAAMLVIAAGLAGSWLVIDQGRTDEASATPQARLEATMLSDRTVAALGAEAPMSAPTTGSSAIRIPDLSATGLKLTSVSTQSGEPASTVLHYRDATGARVALGIAGAPDTSVTPPAMVGKTLVWHRAGIAYALAGTPPADRLRMLARSLQDDVEKE